MASFRIHRWECSSEVNNPCASDDPQLHDNIARNVSPPEKVSFRLKNPHKKESQLTKIALESND